MLFDDTYKEIKKNSTGYYTEKSSKFIAYAYPIYSVDTFKLKLQEIKKKENSANHYCYAYRLHPDKSEFRFSDDGEPAYTAGKPILKQIDYYNLTNILIIVVRYFGGIKLGIPGLIRSYTTASINAIEGSEFVTRLIQEKYIVFFEIQYIQDVMSFIKRHNLDILESSFNKKSQVIFLAPKTKSDLIRSYFNQYHKIELKYAY